MKDGLFITIIAVTVGASLKGVFDLLSIYLKWRLDNTPKAAPDRIKDEAETKVSETARRGDGVFIFSFLMLCVSAYTAAAPAFEDSVLTKGVVYRIAGGLAMTLFWWSEFQKK